MAQSQLAMEMLSESSKEALAWEQHRDGFSHQQRPSQQHHYSLIKGTCFQDVTQILLMKKTNLKDHNQALWNIQLNNMCFSSACAKTKGKQGSFESVGHQEGSTDCWRCRPNYFNLSFFPATPKYLSENTPCYFQRLSPLSLLTKYLLIIMTTISLGETAEYSQPRRIFFQIYLNENLLF